MSSDINQTLYKLFPDLQVIEIRLMSSNYKIGVASGYYNDFKKTELDVLKYDSLLDTESIYFTLNPVNPALLARSSNKIKPKAKQTTSEGDIVKRMYFPFDVDPIRPSGISSTDEEHNLAISTAYEIKGELSKKGFTEPIIIDSGNGAWLLYPIDLPNTPENKSLIKACQLRIAEKFNTDKIKIDCWDDANRICKLPGTITRKGENLPERPHRRSKLLEIPEKRENVSIDTLQKIADILPKEEKKKETTSSKTNNKSWDAVKLKGVLESWGAEIERTKQDGNKTIFVLKTCLWNPEHEGHKEAVVYIDKKGVISYKCHHNSCNNVSWVDVRTKHDPEYAKKREKNQQKPKEKKEKIFVAKELPPIPQEEINQEPLTIDKLITEFKKVLNVEEDINISIPLAFAISNHSHCDPDALGIIGASGSGKTEVVRSLGDTENQYILPISSMTSKTFVSGYKDAQDLAPQLRNRLITIKDFTSILSKNKDEVSGIFADIRDILDGYIQKAFGGDVGKKEFREIHSSFLFACTNAIEKYYSVYSVLGQRLIFYRPLSDARKARKKAMENAGKEKEIREKHHALTMQLINTALKTSKERIENLTQSVPIEMQERIGRLCEFLAIVRTHIDRDFKGDMASLPEPELPTRLTKTLCKIVDAHSILYNRMPTIEDEVTAVRLIYDNIPTERKNVLRALCEFDTPQKTSAIAIAAKIPTSMCNRVLNDLAALEIITRWDRATLDSNSDEWAIIEEKDNDEKQFKTCFLLISNYNLWPIVNEMLKGENSCSVDIEPINKVLNVLKNKEKVINEVKTRGIIERIAKYLYLYLPHIESPPSSLPNAEPQKKENIEFKDKVILNFTRDMLRGYGSRCVELSDGSRELEAANIKARFAISQQEARQYLDSVINEVTA